MFWCGKDYMEMPRVIRVFFEIREYSFVTRKRKVELNLGSLSLKNINLVPQHNSPSKATLFLTLQYIFDILHPLT